MKHAPTAEMLARCSEIVYAGERESSSKWKRRLELDLAEMKIDPLLIIDKSDVQAFVGVHHNHRITCFRGTDSSSDMLTNLFARKVSDPIMPRVKVHKQFARDVDVVMKMADGHGKIDYCDEHIDWFTGHSRGGAAASIMAGRVGWLRKCTHSKLLPVHLVTHEMPRAGGRGFARHLLDYVPHIRWQVAGDLVPLIPMWPFFWHDRSPAYIDSSRKFRPSASLWTRLFEYPAAVRKHIGKAGVAGVALHNMKDLREIIEQEEGDNEGNLLLELLA